MRLKVPSLHIIILLLISVFIILFFLKSTEQQITPENCESLGLPVMHVDTMAGKKINSKTDYVTARYELNEFSGECKIRGHGNTTWQTRELYKKPYLLKLESPAPLLGMENSQKWILMANTADKTSLRNEYSYFLAENIWNRMKWVPDGKFIALFLNGKYNGLYALTEKIEFERLGLTEGSFLAVVNSRMNKEWNFRTSRGTKISIRMKNKTEAEYRSMEKIIQDAEDTLFSDSFKNKDSGWQSVLDEGSFIDWYLVNEFTKNHDAKFQASCYFYYDSASEKIFMGPVWDLDISCGNISYDGCQDPEGFYINTDQWYKRLFEDEYFVGKVKTRWQETREKISDSFEWIETTAEHMKPYVEQNDSVWHNIGKRQWPHAPGWKNRKTYESEIDYMLDFLKKRALWLDTQFN